MSLAFTPGRRTRLTAALLAAMTTVAVGVAQATDATHAAYVATRDNPTSKIATGTVVLRNGSGGTSQTVLGTDLDLRAGTQGQKCVVVKYSGTISGKIYATINGLGTNVQNSKFQLGVDLGPIGSLCDNDFTVASSPRTRVDVASWAAAGTSLGWTATSGQSRAILFTYYSEQGWTATPWTTDDFTVNVEARS